MDESAVARLEVNAKSPALCAVDKIVNVLAHALADDIVILKPYLNIGKAVVRNLRKVRIRKDVAVETCETCALGEEGIVLLIVEFE